jgi:hypothetical protein
MDRIKIPVDTGTPLNVGANFTFEFWMRAKWQDNAGTVAPGLNGDGWITGNVILDRDVYGPGDYGDFGVSIGRSGGGCVLAFGAHNGSWGQTLVGSADVGDGAWHHVACTRVKKSGLMRLYVDGVLDAEAAGPTGSLRYRVGRNTAFPKSDPFLVIGAEKHDAGSAYPSFAGAIDELRVWSRALGEAELAAIAGKVISAKRQTGLVGYWRFEEGTGRVVRDRSPVAGTGRLRFGKAGNGEWVGPLSETGTAPVAPKSP